MLKIAVYGTGYKCHWFLGQMERISNIEIVCYVQTNAKENAFNGKKLISVMELDYNLFDILVITPKDDAEIYELLRSRSDYNADKIMNVREFVQYCLLDKIKKNPFCLVDINKWADINPYFSAKTSENLEYICTSKDRIIAEVMRRTKKTFAYNEIELFFQLVKKYYQKELGEATCFLDVGGNIGTTSIYVKKIVDPKLRVVAVEPNHRNVKTFKCNCILNDCEDIEICECGISDKKGSAVAIFDEANPGNAQVCSHLLDTDVESNECTLVTIDELLKQYCISDLGYLWIDTQGYEVNAIVGAKNTLSSKRIPIYMEFNPSKYDDVDKWKKFVFIMSQKYHGFLDIDNEYMRGKCIEHSISELNDYKKIENMPGFENAWSWTNLFFF